MSLSLDDEAYLLDYLEQFNYLRPGEVAHADDAAAHVATLQDLLGLEPTGEPTPQLVRLLRETPRCGCADVLAMEVAEQIRKWGRRDLTYCITDFVGGIAPDAQRALARQAWDDWQAAADLRLTEVASAQQAHIVISAGRGRQHGFDGATGVLAWAQLPSGNDRQLLMRFDLDETWLAGVQPGRRGIVYRNVACHEFGHLLGLDHSRVRTALMAPYYSESVQSPQDNDDVSRIRSLYGPPTSPPPSPRRVVRMEVPEDVDVEIPGRRVTRLLTA